MINYMIGPSLNWFYRTIQKACHKLRQFSEVDILLGQICKQTILIEV